jgi:hypothetical protein
MADDPLVRKHSGGLPLAMASTSLKYKQGGGKKTGGGATAPFRDVTRQGAVFDKRRPAAQQTMRYFEVALWRIHHGSSGTSTCTR